MENDIMEDKSPPENDAPLFGYWKGWYYVLVGFLIFQILLYFLITTWLS
ncbi:MAG: hypothetical protein WD334_04555 [Chitinophagales bacterium]